jgi:hypothetical protein
VAKSNLGLFVVITAMLAASASPHSPIYRCTVNGQTVLTDKPCDGPTTVPTSGVTGLTPSGPVSGQLSGAQTIVGAWSGQTQFQGAENAQVIEAAHSVVPLVLTFSADGKVSGSSADEAHRLPNVYKNTSKIASTIKHAIAEFPKVFLTATPLQNSLLELYGLVNIIDDFAFGDLKSYRARFARLGDDSDFAELKTRLAPLCKRTLRRQVLEYVKYANRHALAQEFAPSEDEQRLYDHVSEYLQQQKLYALPASQRQLVTLVLRKLACLIDLRNIGNP